jgi:hypothetical protein
MTGLTEEQIEYFFSTIVFGNKDIEVEGEGGTIMELKLIRQIGRGLHEKPVEVFVQGSAFPAVVLMFPLVPMSE